ncbi:MAG: peptidyl-prolyl cis-trans isomerase [Pseudomonadota bacterium]
MITFFRRILSSWVVLGLFALILVAFVVTGVNLPDGSSIGSLGSTSEAPAQIGRNDLSAQDVLQRTQAEFDAARRENPGLTLAAFVRSGAVEQTVDQMISLRTLESFANDEGIFASKRLIDGEIASIPAFRGPTGQFDRNVFLGILGQQRLTEKGVRSDIGREKIATMLAVPVSAGLRVPLGFALPYTSVLLETRQGQVASIPNSAIPAGKPVTDSEIQAYYKANSARYTAPEMRSIRYAQFDRMRFASQSSPTEVEIAAAYKAKSGQFADKETRVLTQIIVADQAKANAIAAQIKAGTSIEAAAKAAGGEATTLAEQNKAAYAGLTSAKIADAVFAATQNDIVTPGKSGLGWHVVRVDKIIRTSGKTLADARAALIPELAKAKNEGLLADFITKIEDAIADGATFDDVVKSESLTAEVTPMITQIGGAPKDSTYKLPGELAPILRDAFQAEADDDATVIALSAGQSYILYDLDRITVAAPRPIAEISDRIKSDMENERRSKAARAIASAIIAKVGKGTPINEALRTSGVSLPPAQPISIRRIDLLELQNKAPPALDTLFKMGKNQARLIESPNNNGWSVVTLDKVITASAISEPGLVQQTQQQMIQIVGQEYTLQFTSALKTEVGAKRNPTAIAKLKRDLTGASSR